MLPPLLGLLLDCAKKSDQTVVSIALGALVHLVEVGGHQFNDRDWDTLLNSIRFGSFIVWSFICSMFSVYSAHFCTDCQLNFRDATYTTQPLELLNSFGLDNSSSHSAVSNHFDNNSPKELNGLNLVNSTGGISPRTKFESPRKSLSPTFSRNVSSNGALQMDSKNSEGLVPDRLELTNTMLAMIKSDVLNHGIVFNILGQSSPKPVDAENLQRNQTLGQRLMGNMMDNLLLRSLTSKSKKHQVDALVPSSPVKVIF